MLSWLKSLFGGGYFSGFTTAEKRDLMDRNVLLLEGEKGRRAGTVQVVDFAGGHSLIERLTTVELDRLIEIRRLMMKADATSGPQAIALYTRVSRMAPWDEIAVMSIGVEHANAGQFGVAIRWLERALAMNPSNARVQRNLDGVKAAAKGRR